MPGEGGHAGGREGQSLVFTALRGAQQEAYTLLGRRGLPSIETWAHTSEGLAGALRDGVPAWAGLQYRWRCSSGEGWGAVRDTHSAQQRTWFKSQLLGVSNPVNVWARDGE